MPRFHTGTTQASSYISFGFREIGDPQAQRQARPQITVMIESSSAPPPTSCSTEMPMPIPAPVVSHKSLTTVNPKKTQKKPLWSARLSKLAAFQLLGRTPITATQHQSPATVNLQGASMARSPTCIPSSRHPPQNSASSPGNTRYRTQPSTLVARPRRIRRALLTSALNPPHRHHELHSELPGCTTNVMTPSLLSGSRCECCRRPPQAGNSVGAWFASSQPGQRLPGGTARHILHGDWPLGHPHPLNRIPSPADALSRRSRCSQVATKTQATLATPRYCGSPLLLPLCIAAFVTAPTSHGRRKGPALAPS